MSYQQHVEAARSRLDGCAALKDHSYLISLWSQSKLNVIDWQASASPAALSADGLSIHVYPSFGQLPPQSAVQLLLREFGLLVYYRAGRPRETWETKPDLPEAGAINAFQAKLASGRFQSFKLLVDDFKTATDRYTALNIANALIANGVGIKSATNLDIKSWGATAEYAALKKPHRLDGLLAAYTPREMLDCYGEAFADMVLNESRSTLESSLRKGFQRVVLGIAERTR